MSSIYNDDLLRTLPNVLKEDKNFRAYATVMAKQLRNVIDDTDCAMIYARIDKLPEALLDILAYDFKVDWWDYGYTVEQKRKTLKDSFLVHKHLGTKFAVETAISAIYPDTTVEEWFEYDGEPYHFRLAIDATVLSGDSERYKRVLELANYYKNLRSHLDKVVYTIYPTAAGAVCASAAVGSYMRTTVKVHIPGEVDSPHSQISVSTGAAITGTYTKFTVEVTTNELE